jgi:hypothetical protein
VIKKVAERILKPYNRNSEHVEYKSKEWKLLEPSQNHSEITRTTNIPGKHGIKELWALRRYFGKYQRENTEHN